MDLITNRGDIFREVKSRVNIIDVASRLQLNLTKQGSDLVGECPTGHASKSKKSFHIVTSHREPYFHCFNCGKGGDVIRLVSITKNINDLEAAKWLIDEFNLKIDTNQLLHNQPSPEQSKEKEELISRNAVLEKIYEICKAKLYQEEGKAALDYLVNVRGYNEGTLKKTEWFYLPEISKLKTELLSQFPEMRDSLDKIKLTGYFGDNFRLAFPYRNADGYITGFMKRSTDATGVSITTHDGKSHSTVRWDSTPGLKKNDLFGLDKVDHKEDTLIVVEGYPDAIYLQALGMTNIVAVGQGRLTSSHLIELRRRKIKNLIIAFDNDAVGPKNTRDAVELILKNSRITPYVLDPTNYGGVKDPDEYFKEHGFAMLDNLLQTKPEDGVLWVVKKLFKSVEGDNSLAIKKVKEEVVELLTNVYDTDIIESVRTETDHFSTETKSSFLRLVKSKRKNDSDAVLKQFTEQPIVPFLDLNSSTRCYYNRSEDKLSLGVDEKFIGDVMWNYGLPAPINYPAFMVEFNPVSLDGKFDIKNKRFNLFSPTVYMYLSKTDAKIDLSTACSRTFELLQNLIPKKEERDHFINWLSYVFTTRKKARTSWVLRGSQGAGKNLFFSKIIKPLFGDQQTMVVDDDRLQSDFNGFMKNKLFVAFNEVASNETKSKISVKSKIKAIVSDDAININEKHVKTFEVSNFANILFFSNEAIPILIENQDRRFNVIETGGSLKLIKSFKADPEKFIECLEDELSDFAQYLLNYNSDVLLVDEVLENKEKQQIKELSMSRFELFAVKLKAKDWDWFDENLPADNNFWNKDIRRELINEKHLEARKVLRETAYSTFNSINDHLVSKTKLTQQLNLYGIHLKRKKNTDAPDEYYYEW